MQDFDAAGIAVYALSYDEADALRDFRDAHGITYTLLSDPDSDVIRSFGILNTLIDPDDHPWYGIPYPGTYVVSAEGAITHKFFDNNLAVRAGPEQLLRAAQNFLPGGFDCSQRGQAISAANSSPHSPQKAASSRFSNAQLGQSIDQAYRARSEAGR